MSEPHTRFMVNLKLKDESKENAKISAETKSRRNLVPDCRKNCYLKEFKNSTKHR
jgi:hypothetical protein